MTNDYSTCPLCQADTTPLNTSQCARPGCKNRAHRYGPPCAPKAFRIYCKADQPAPGGPR